MKKLFMFIIAALTLVVMTVAVSAATLTVTPDPASVNDGGSVQLTAIYTDGEVLSADAGPDQTVYEGATVTLGGTYSTGAITSWLWTQTAGPTVAISGANQATAVFVAPSVTAATSLTFQLTVSDGTNTAFDTVFVTVLPAGAGTPIIGCGTYTGGVDYIVPTAITDPGDCIIIIGSGPTSITCLPDASITAGGTGIELMPGVNDVTIQGCDITAVGPCIKGTSNSNIYVYDNTCESEDKAFRFDNYYDVTIDSNYIALDGIGNLNVGGVALMTGNTAEVTGNTIHTDILGKRVAAEVVKGTNVRIGGSNAGEGNTIASEFDYGVMLYQSDGTEVIGNDFSGCNKANAYVFESDNCVIENNLFNNGAGYGIKVTEGSDYNTFTGNEVCGNVRTDVMDWNGDAKTNTYTSTRCWDSSPAGICELPCEMVDTDGDGIPDVKEPGCELYIDCDGDDVCDGPGSIIPPVCSDTDGGLYYDILGTVTDNAGSYTDYCSDANTVVEYYCQSGAEAQTYYDCSTEGKECDGGVCKEGPLTIYPKPGNMDDGGVQQMTAIHIVDGEVTTLVGWAVTSGPCIIDGAGFLTAYEGCADTVCWVEAIYPVDGSEDTAILYVDDNDVANTYNLNCFPVNGGTPIMCTCTKMSSGDGCNRGPGTSSCIGGCYTGTDITDPAYSMYTAQCGTATTTAAIN